MNAYSFAALFALLAVANASGLSSARILQGPSSRSTVVGPDGSAISAVAPGGQIVHEESVGVVAQSAPIVAAPALAYSAPVVAGHPAPLFAGRVAAAYSSPVVAARSAPLVSAYSAPVVAAHSAPLVSTYSAPVVAAHSAPLVSAYSAPVVAAHSAPLVSAYTTPVVAGVASHSSVDTVVAGPSGTIATGRSVAAPVVSAW